jgi:hypothetical protein
VLGMLIVIFGRYVITGGLRIACKLDIFLCDMGRIAPDFHIWSVGFEHADHRIVALPVIIPPAHPLILTVSHDVPVLIPSVDLACTQPGPAFFLSKQPQWHPPIRVPSGK